MTGPVVLRRGDRGNAVRDLSTRLGLRLRSHPAAHDVFDETLETAVRAFQQQRGLRVDGICGPETWGALIESGFLLGTACSTCRVTCCGATTSPSSSVG